MVKNGADIKEHEALVELSDICTSAAVSRYFQKGENYRAIISAVLSGSSPAEISNAFSDQQRKNQPWSAAELLLCGYSGTDLTGAKEALRSVNDKLLLHEPLPGLYIIFTSRNAYKELSHVGIVPEDSGAVAFLSDKPAPAEPSFLVVPVAGNYGEYSGIPKDLSSDGAVRHELSHLFESFGVVPFTPCQQSKGFIHFRGELVAHLLEGLDSIRGKDPCHGLVYTQDLSDVESATKVRDVAVACSEIFKAIEGKDAWQGRFTSIALGKVFEAVSYQDTERAFLETLDLISAKAAASYLIHNGLSSNSFDGKSVLQYLTVANNGENYLFFREAFSENMVRFFKEDYTPIHNKINRSFEVAMALGITSEEHDKIWAEIIASKCSIPESAALQIINNKNIFKYLTKLNADSLTGCILSNITDQTSVNTLIEKLDAADYILLRLTLESSAEFITDYENMLRTEYRIPLDQPLREEHANGILSRKSALKELENFLAACN